MLIEIKNILTFLSVDDDFAVKNIYIKDDMIVGIGSKPDDFAIDKTIDGKGRLLIPGFINSHTHSYMSLFRNCADDLPFEDWLFKRILPLEEKLTGEDAYWGTLLSCLEMIKSGTTCFLDMHMFKDMIVKATCDSGMRAVISRGLTGSSSSGVVEDGGKLQEALDEMKNYQSTSNDGRITFFLAPHAIYTCDAGYIKHILDVASEFSLGIHIHLSESRKEVSDCIEKYQKTPVEFLQELGLFKHHTVAAHCVHLTDDDIRILAENHVNVATNPISNMKLGNGFAPIPKLLKAGVNISLGTDSSASNNSLNMFRELSTITLIHKGANEDSTSISALDGFRFATENSAKALMLKDSVGKIRLGMKADLVILNINTPNFYPQNNLISGLAYSATGAEVESVIINGKIVMENKEVKSIDSERVYYEINRISKKLF